MPTRPLSTFACTVTPFDEEGRLDQGALAWLLDRLADAGVGVFLGTASPGEAHALSLDETERLYAVAKETVHGRVPVRAMGREPRKAEDFAPLIRIAESVGLDAMQLYCIDLGHGMKPTDAELERYFRTLLEGMTIPAVISTHFLSTYLVPLDILQRLLDEYPGIIGINCTSPDLSYLSRVIDLAHGRADVHVGGPQQAVTALALGAQGFLSSEAILVPRLCASIIGNYGDGRVDQMSRAFADLIRFSRINVWPSGSVRFTKAVMRVLGLPGWHIRPPFMALDDAAHERIAKEVRALDIPELQPVA